MGLRVNTNIASITAQRNLSEVTSRLSDNYRRLSTGLRISRASDDAAGLAISERLRGQLRSLEVAKRNVNDGISLLQTAEGALGEVNNMLIRLRELAIQSSNGTLGGGEQDVLDEEFQSLIAEIDRIAQATEFNNVNLLDGSSSTVSLQIGFGTTAGVDTLDVTLSAALATTLGLNTLDIGSGGAPTAAVGAVDNAIDSITSLRGQLGAAQNRLDSTVRNLDNQFENLSAANSRIRDVDVAYETAALTRNVILQQAAISILAQANAQPQAALTLLA